MDELDELYLLYYTTILYYYTILLYYTTILQGCPKNEREQEGAPLRLETDPRESASFYLLVLFSEANSFNNFNLFSEANSFWFWWGAGKSNSFNKYNSFYFIAPVVKPIHLINTIHSWIGAS